MKKNLFLALQYITPKHPLSRLIGALADCQIETVKNTLIRLFLRFYDVKMDEAENPNALTYPSFNAFFCRELKAGARPIDSQNNSLSSPADGEISQIGDIHENSILQAKSKHFSLEALLGGNTALAQHYAKGKFATIYLAPINYHRVHMPVDGILSSMSYVPGKLYSVNHTSAASIDGLFAKNERVICVFDTAFGKITLILVGAMIVGSIETVWAGQVAPMVRKIHSSNYQSHSDITFKKGEEIGRFKLGSTVIVLTPPNTSLEWEPSLKTGSQVTMGQALGATSKSIKKTNTKNKIKKETKNITETEIKAELKTNERKVPTLLLKLLTKEAIKAQRKNTFHIGQAETEIGLTSIIWQDQNIFFMGFSDSTDLEPLFKKTFGEDAALQQNNTSAKEILDAIFTDKNANRSFQLWAKGTDFQISVWQYLLTIPTADSCNYNDIATAIGKPTAVRAVGNAVGANPIAYLIPCHRVLPKSNKAGSKITELGGYHWGTEIKKRLLAKEGLI